MTYAAYLNILHFPCLSQNLSFADKVLYTTTENTETQSPGAAFIFDKITVTNALIKKLPHEQAKKTERDSSIPISYLEKRLSLLEH